MSARDRARERLQREEQERRAAPGAAPPPAPQPQRVGGDRANEGGIRGLITGERQPQGPGPGFSFEEAGRRAGRPAQGALAQVLASGVSRAASETVDGLGAISAAFRRWYLTNGGRIVGGPEDGRTFTTEEYDSWVADRQRRVPRVDGRPLWDEASGEFMPGAPDWVQRPTSTAGRFAEGLVQFVTGYATLGRVIGPASNLGRLQLGGRAIAQGAVTDFFVWDGNEARLSNLLRDWADLRDPVTAYLAASEDDPEIEGRIKSTLEGAALGLAFESFFAGLRALRAQRRHFTAPTPQTEADLAEAARQVNAAAEADAARAAIAVRNEARASRRAEIDSNAQTDITRLDNETFGAGTDSRLSAVPNESEMVAINRGEVDPTALSPRQQEAVARHTAERASVEARRAELHRIEDMREAAEEGNTAEVLRVFQEINKARTPPPIPAGPNPLRMTLARGGRPITKIGREIVQDADGDVWNIAELTARVQRDGSVVLVPKGARGSVAAADEGIPRPSRIQQAAENVLEQPTLADVKQRLGLPATATMAETTEAAQRAGYTALKFNGTAGHETVQIAAVQPQPRFEPSSHTVDIIPGSPVRPEEMVRVARSQSSRMASAADAPPTHAEGLQLKSEADRVSALADELSETIANGGNVNQAAARLQAHLDDEALAALYRRRQPGEVDAAIGQTDAQSFARAVGDAAPETPVIDEAFVRQVAEHYALSGDVASAAVRQQADAWRAGDPITHARDINLSNIQTEDAVKAFILSFTELSEGAIRHIRGETAGATQIGSRLDSQVRRTAEALAKDAGSDSGSLFVRLADITGSTQNLDAKIESLRILQVTAADEAQRTMRAYLASHADADLNRALIALQAFASVHSTLKGATSEVARALRIMQHQVSAFPEKSIVEQFSQIVDEGLVRSLDPSGGSRTALDALQRMAGAVTHTNRRGVGRLFEPKWHRAVEDWYTASILSAPSTHVLNFLGNAATTLIAPVERMLGGLPAALRGDISVIREGFDHAIGIMAASKEAVRFALRAFKENRTFLDSTFSADYRSSFRAEAFGANPDRALGHTLNGLGKVIGIVHRFMGSQDEFFKQLNYRAILYGNALREARAQGIRDGASLRTFVNEYVAAGFDGNGHSIRAGVSPDQANLINNAYDRALREARRNTFTEPIGKTLGQFERGLRAIPLGRLVIPFFRTPISIVKYAARRSGVSGTFWADARGKNGRHVQAQALGQVSLGVIVYGTALSYALNGQITGRGPSDPRVRQRLIEAGWSPYSIRIGDKYYSYNRADPFGMFLGVVGDMYEMANEEYAERPDDPLEVGGLAIVNLAQMMRDKTFFQGVANVFAVMENADENRELEQVEKLLGNYAGAFAVPTAVSRATDDGFMHRPRSLLDSVAARTPFRDGVEYRRNWLGERAGQPAPLLGHAFISPFTSTQTSDDVVLNELARVAAVSRGGVSDIPRRINGVDLTEFRSPVTGRNAYDRLQEHLIETHIRGMTLRERLTQFIESPAYQTRLTDGTFDGDLETRGTRQSGIVRIRSQYLRAATRELRREIPELDARLRQAESMHRQSRRPNRGNTDRGSNLPRGLEWLAQDDAAP